MLKTLENIKKLPRTPGIYKFSDSTGKIIYIGKAINLRNRVLSYLRPNNQLDAKTRAMVKKARYVNFIKVFSDFEALVLESVLIRKYLPGYNIIWRDDKHYIYIKITGDKFPGVLLARHENNDRSLYFGPFPSKAVATDILGIIRKIFPFCNQNPTAKRACFYTHLGLCNPCPAIVRKTSGEEYRIYRSQYLENIRNIKDLLKAKSARLIKKLSDEMMEFSNQQKFERAIIMRERIEKLEYLNFKRFSALSYIENPYLSQKTHQKELTQLSEILRIYFPGLQVVKRIECYDISNISGTSSAGSMVTFVAGEPDKNYYRRFHIKRLNTPNDFAMLEEVMERRLKHKNWPLPDLFVLDGGKPQLQKIISVFKKNNISVPLIGLAKIEEELVIPSGDNNFIKIKLPKGSPALNLMKRIRDEAHRFAHKYHELIRMKNLTNLFA
ncbi:hypothetical protein A3D03_03565 [Candidatus Gottesmanbacteria bacterium RIFCSPHIGHO2_02_FULL_40_13]|uniref:Excinuclease ABC subunit C n=1 Tax=Candidatus Gottesmanbacteria bacterium RIFCSPHIGHO2_02_FULL_40_13 TaxID=1798384 RepID=A0A1F6A6K4_9BACT|nr:MAG: hypothetical protein A3D03_03565 [Candidatus Gottesmanbacteria bacterium RIFCSPHIGHO2_02_FULL_40_13]